MPLAFKVAKNGLKIVFTMLVENSDFFIGFKKIIKNDDEFYLVRFLMGIVFRHKKNFKMTLFF